MTSTSTVTLTLGGKTAASGTTKTQAELSAQDVEDFGRCATYFSDKPNTEVLKVDFDSDAEAQDYRDKIKMYADKHDLSAGLPKYVAEHMSKAVVDDETGKITKPAKLIPANKYPRHWNVGRNVTFRFAPHRDKSEVDTKTVTVSKAQK